LEREADDIPSSDWKVKPVTMGIDGAPDLDASTVAVAEGFR
jgi:hypothetical protein